MDEVTLEEMARRLGVTVDDAAQRVDRPAFPAPQLRDGTRVWSWVAVYAWVNAGYEVSNGSDAGFAIVPFNALTVT